MNAGSRDHLVPRSQLDGDGVVRTHYVKPAQPEQSRFAPPASVPPATRRRYPFSGAVPVPDGMRTEIVAGLSAGQSTLAETLATNGWHHKDSAMDISEATVDIEDVITESGAETPDEIAEIMTVSGFVQDTRASAVNAVVEDLRESAVNGDRPDFSEAQLVALGSGPDVSLIAERSDLTPTFLMDVSSHPDVPDEVRARYVRHSNADANLINYAATDPTEVVRTAAASSHLISEEKVDYLLRTEARGSRVLDALADNSSVTGFRHVIALERSALN